MTDHCAECNHKNGKKEKFCPMCGYQIVVAHMRVRKKTVCRAIITFLLLALVYAIWVISRS